MKLLRVCVRHFRFWLVFAWLMTAVWCVCVTSQLAILFALDWCIENVMLMKALQHWDQKEIWSCVSSLRWYVIWVWSSITCLYSFLFTGTSVFSHWSELQGITKQHFSSEAFFAFITGWLIRKMQRTKQCCVIRTFTSHWFVAAMQKRMVALLGQTCKVGLKLVAHCAPKDAIKRIVGKGNGYCRAEY